MRFDLVVNLLTARALRERRRRGARRRPVAPAGARRRRRPRRLPRARLTRRRPAETFNVGSDALNLRIARPRRAHRRALSRLAASRCSETRDPRSYRVSLRPHARELGFQPGRTRRIAAWTRSRPGSRARPVDADDRARPTSTRSTSSPLRARTPAPPTVPAPRMPPASPALAADGGTPGARHLPARRPALDRRGREARAVLETLESGWMTTGPKAIELGRRIAETLAARPHGLAVNSCTGALHLALAALGVGPGRRGHHLDLDLRLHRQRRPAPAARARAGRRRRRAPRTSTRRGSRPRSRRARRPCIAVDFAGQPADYDALAALCAASAGCDCWPRRRARRSAPRWRGRPSARWPTPPASRSTPSRTSPPARAAPRHRTTPTSWRRPRCCRCTASRRTPGSATRARARGTTR